MGDDLTHESQYLLYTMYKSYLQNRKAGKLIRDSRYFDPVELYNQQFKSYNIEDFFDLLRELDRHGYADVLYGDDEPIRCSLSEKAIRAGENRFKNQLNAVADGLIKVKKIISPLG